jgi:anti-anti-sigma regulatory factor
VSQRSRPTVDIRVISHRTTVTTLSGEHDLFTKKRVLEALALARARQCRNVIVDLTRCEFLDSTITQALITAHRAGQPGERFEFVVPANVGFVNRVLSPMAMHGIITTHGSLEDALSSMGEPTPSAA